MQAREQALVIGDPVEGGGREHCIHRALQIQLQQIQLAYVSIGSETLAGGCDHGGRGVYGDHAPPWQALDQCLCHPARAAAGVEHGLIAAQLQAREDFEAQGRHGP